MQAECVLCHTSSDHDRGGIRLQTGTVTTTVDPRAENLVTEEGGGGLGSLGT
jgi:hypothetical protein